MCGSGIKEGETNQAKIGDYAMEISFSKARAGDVLVFRRNPEDFVSGVLTLVLQRLDSDFSKWVKKERFSPWHTAPITRKAVGGVQTMCAKTSGAEVAYYPEWYIKKECKIYRWLKEKPTAIEVDAFIAEVTGASYDFKAYFSTIFFYFISKIFKQDYRIQDRSYHCWEITSYAMREWGGRLVRMWEYPLISNMIKNLDGNRLS